jgi:hypothetical protein
MLVSDLHVGLKPHDLHHDVPEEPWHVADEDAESFHVVLAACERKGDCGADYRQGEESSGTECGSDRDADPQSWRRERQLTDRQLDQPTGVWERRVMRTDEVDPSIQEMDYAIRSVSQTPRSGDRADLNQPALRPRDERDRGA